MTTGTYTYSLLQYVHSQVLGEVVNIGLLCIFPDQQQVIFRSAENLSRPKGLYPNFPESLIRVYLKGFEQKSREINRQWPLFSDALASKSPATFIQEEFLYKDDSALQFSEPKTGVTYSADCNVIATHLYDQYLGKYQQKTVAPVRHNEDYILRSYKRLLQGQDSEIVKFLKTDYVISEKVNLKFDLAWQNGSLHLVKPLSFDLATPQEIQAKSVVYLGYLTVLEEVAQKKNYTFDFLITRPQLPQPDLKNAYQNAIGILQEGKAPKAIIEENQLAAYTEKTIAEIVRP